MPAGRNQVDYTDIEFGAQPFKIDNSTIVYDGTKARGAAATMLDKAVTLSADDTIALCADADFVLGKLLSVESDGFASVQTDGFCQLPAGNAATVTRGNRIVGALGAASAKGYIRDAAAGSIPEAIKSSGRVINIADSTAVWVEFY